MFSVAQRPSRPAVATDVTPIAPPPIPLSVPAVDAAWLEAALRAAGHDVTVTSCAHVAVVGGNATKIRLVVTYGGDHGDLPRAVCVKVGMELQDPSLNLTGST
jgi:hypothetical protein